MSNSSCKRLKPMVVSALLAASLASCDYFEYHPYATKISGPKHLLESKLADIEERCKGRDTICFAFLTDTQGFNDELKTAVNAINTMDRVQFVIHGGDQTDFGLIKEFEWCRNELERLTKPYCIVIGNHDCIGTGEHTYATIYGTSDYSFNASFCHFLCLNTVALEYDYSNPVPNFSFIENDYDNVTALNASTDSIGHTVVVMHAPPFSDQFNNNVAKPFEYYLKRFPGATDADERYDLPADTLKHQTLKHACCVFGHTHVTGVNHFFRDGLLYYSSTMLGNRQFLVFTITKNGYECEPVDF